MQCYRVILNHGAAPIIPNRCALCDSEAPDDAVTARSPWVTLAGIVLAFLGFAEKRAVAFQACRSCAKAYRRDQRIEAALTVVPMLGVLAVAALATFPSRIWALIGIVSMGIVALWPSAAFRQRRPEPIVVMRRSDRTEFYFTCGEYGVAFGDVNADSALPGVWEWTSRKAAIRHGPRRFLRRWMRTLRDAMPSRSDADRNSPEKERP